VLERHDHSERRARSLRRRSHALHDDPIRSIVTLRPAAFGRHRFKVEDRMNPSDAASLDVFQPSCSRAIDFGIRHERVTVTSR